jgi:preprotein translocase subunit SecA
MIVAQLLSVLFHAQSRRNFRKRFKRRAYLLGFDDVLHDQRELVQKQKQIILHDKCLKERLKKAAAELTGDMIESFEDSQWYDLASSLGEFLVSLRTTLGCHLAIDVDSEELFRTELLRKRIVQDLEHTIEEREKIVGPDNLNMFIRDLYLRVIDAKWEDYLERMKTARAVLCLWEDEEGGSPDEYRTEGFKMIEETQKEAVQKFFLMPVDLFWKYNECFSIV